MLVGILFALQFRSVQTYVARQVASYLSNELHTKIEIEEVYLKPFSSLSLRNLYIEDLSHDTLLFAQELRAGIDLESIRSKEITIKDLTLSNSRFYLKKKADSVNNLTFILDYFSAPKQPKRKSSFIVNLNSLKLNNIHFRYKNELVKRHTAGVNFNDIDILGLHGDFSTIDFKNFLLKADIKGLKFKEKSGFELKRLDASFKMDSTSMNFENLSVQTNRSKLGKQLRFKYATLADFANFIEKVEIYAETEDTRVDSRDIAFFAPGMNQVAFNVGLSGKLKGTVRHFKGERLLLKTGKATYLRGNISVAGLPDIEKTIFDLDLEQFATIKTDLEPSIAGFSGQKDFKLPAILTSLGHVNYTGKARGFYNDFQLDGSLKTVLGQVDARVAINLKDENSYEGSLKAERFNISGLLDNRQVGSVSLQADIQGTGFSLNELNANIKSQIASVIYKGKNYRNIRLDGTVDARVLHAQVDVNDRNLKLQGEAAVDFRSSETSYDFSTIVEKANLLEMGLIKDSLQLEGQVTGKFQGNTINNIVGNARLHHIVLRKPSSSISIDSIVFLAEGERSNRKIAVQSDMLDATMNGEIDLASFPSYFKSVAKRYLPSWEIEQKSSKQVFDFALKLKRSEPLLLLFAPFITIPDTMFVNGKFSTVDSTANLNAYIPMVEVGKIKVTDIIVDGVAMDESLNLTVTADQLNITDSLYVKNINIANILSDDSLRFNMKLSDVDAKNQLDLNGLVEFNEKEAAILSLLPSNVIINREDWKLEEKVNFDFHGGNIHVNDFELANGEQHVKIDGLISKDEEDVLNVSFDKFNLVTLAGIMNPLGIELEGKLNGNFQLFSLLKNPYISADINSSDIYYNGREIGDMTLTAKMDPASDLVGMNMEVNRQGTKTLRITGSYDAKASENSLDLIANLEDSEIVLFEPFLKKLVSDLTGTVSAAISIKGTPWSPIISGDCEFRNASFTVNYLKTRYTINDRVGVNNSSIELKDLDILDKNNNKAVANGSVDMSNPLDPVIDVQINAKKFMVLNTTAKDNPLYYGIGIGTGDFVFKGPTSNMDIDIKAATEEGTSFNIPLNASGTVSENDFITFVSKDSTFSETRGSYFDGLTLHIDLDISRNAQATIITDLGKLSGVGNGNITMNITSLGDFEMFGEYVILQGKFTFTAQDFINKIFEINRGGTIRWTGNPAEALINLTAMYEVRTSVRPLYTAAGRQGTDQRVVAQAEMILAGNLLHPDISFAIDFPVDSYVKDELQSYLSDANNVNQQALSLIVRRSFAPGTGTDLTTELNSTFLSAGTELAFNQLNNIISQSLNLNFVDFNIRSLNEASASIRLLNNRLILTGGITDRRSQLNDLNVFGNQVASDVEALYLIRKNGNLLFRASNRLNNRNFLNPTDEYVSAFGLVYRQDFDTFGEFFKRMFMLTRKKKEEEEENPKPIQEKEESTSVKGSKVN